MTAPTCVLLGLWQWQWRDQVVVDKSDQQVVWLVLLTCVWLRLCWLTGGIEEEGRCVTNLFEVGPPGTQTVKQALYTVCEAPGGQG